MGDERGGCSSGFFGDDFIWIIILIIIIFCFCGGGFFGGCRND